MTDAQLVKRASKCVAKWAQKLLMDPWRFDVQVVEEVMGIPNSAAAVSMPRSYLTATIEFRRGWLEEASDQQLDETTIHELLHCMMRDYHHHARDAVDHMSSATGLQYEETLDHESEQLIDRLSWVLFAHISD